MTARELFDKKVANEGIFTLSSLSVIQFAEELQRQTLSKISSFIAEKRKQQDHVLLGELEKLIKEI